MSKEVFGVGLEPPGVALNREPVAVGEQALSTALESWLWHSPPVEMFPPAEDLGDAWVGWRA
jgi:hypothetical protein